MDDRFRDGLLAVESDESDWSLLRLLVFMVRLFSFVCGEEENNFKLILVIW